MVEEIYRWAGLSSIVTNIVPISSLIKRAFNALTGEDCRIEEPAYGEDKSIYLARPNISAKWFAKILSERQLKEKYRKKGGRRTNLVGFALRTEYGGRMYIQQEELDVVLRVIGHEIGHLMGNDLIPLCSGLYEEAKAFAFEKAWCDIIQEKNFWGLRNRIRPIEVSLKEDIHWRAYEFVATKTGMGYEPFRLFQDISQMRVSLEDF